jgi:hypothetical protein
MVLQKDSPYECCYFLDFSIFDSSYIVFYELSILGLTISLMGRRLKKETEDTAIGERLFKVGKPAKRSDDLRKIVLFCITFSFLLSACSQNDKFHSETLYYYSGQMLSLVDQGKSDYSKELGIRYTLMLVDFRPQEMVFEKFRESYKGASNNNGHIVITDRTKVYIRNETNSKTLISVTDLYKYIKPVGSEDYPKIEIWVTPFRKSDYEIETVEIVLLHE